MGCLTRRGGVVVVVLRNEVCSLNLFEPCRVMMHVVKCKKQGL